MVQIGTISAFVNLGPQPLKVFKVLKLLTVLKVSKAGGQECIVFIYMAQSVLFYSIWARARFGVKPGELKTLKVLKL
jgi:hypothetical protein